MTKFEKMEKRLRYLLESEASEAQAFKKFEKEFSKKDLEELKGGEAKKVEEPKKVLEGEEKRQADKRTPKAEK